MERETIEKEWNIISHDWMLLFSVLTQRAHQNPSFCTILPSQSSQPPLRLQPSKRKKSQNTIFIDFMHAPYYSKDD